MDAKEKTNAFRLYDFEGDAKWKTYLQKVDISGTDYNTKLLKLKAKWYKREVDADFELEWLTKYTSARSYGEVKEETRNEASGDAGQHRRSIVPPSGAMALIHFSMTVLGVMSMLPLCPRMVHILFLQSVIGSSVLKALQRFGRPKFRPLEELKRWTATALNTTDSQYGFVALLFLPNVPTRLVFIPSTVLAGYHLMHYCSVKFKERGVWRRYGRRLHDYMTKRQNDALTLNAVSEIMTGFLCIFQIFSAPRFALVAFLYWQWLRMRYWSTDAAAIHRQAWSHLGRRTEPILRLVPFLKGPINYVQNWFTRPA